MPSVLIVDDAPLRAGWLAALLENMGWECHRSLVHSTALPPSDITLVALQLAQANGFEFATGLRAQGRSRIWLMSDRPRETDSLWARSLGLKGVLRVPAPSASLGALLLGCLEDGA